ncbi:MULTISPECIES: DNA mismatch repair endonuclease MutL [Pseudanabaena]|uniref:DNA mismatch repair endonuclease MutL n=1 Tax=Pseudanabaena TaxID=1152 RepID=UPI00247A2ED5|nr:MULTISPECIES: DNA mismatch repair endonuclease MutL [Pseudanabaena]MEA5486402.1 DNA mismatch repair endonuclease MutL [Pseudanabaena sp. CCNP1317]WGS71451.1 DNA mismatch repair endonuclease MutL [Pseudanabaena galeata CCNP1313]
MQNIHTLPIEVVHLIAAGEVIDSLVAVVRELAENAIDANATRIVISIWTDSLSVQVSDNGCGMAIADLSQAATPHTTSKINNAEDLQQINSLGFRGEALYSLAQLADLNICSRPVLEPVGYQAHYDEHGNLQTSPKVVAIASGTVVTVRNLFSRYPNRLQSLPSNSQQVRKVQLQIQQMAIANPQVNWQVNLDNREWMTIWAGENASEILPQIISSIQPYDLVYKEFALIPQPLLPLGEKGSKSLAPLSPIGRGAGGEGLSLTLGLPDRLSRRRPDWVKIILNGRVINFPELEQTILFNLERTLPRNRYPVCIVNLNLPCDRIDWNRHPAKAEAYIQDLGEIQTQLKECITEALKATISSSPINYGSAANDLLKTAERKTSYLIPAKRETFNQPNSSLKAIAQVLDTYILAEHAGGLWLVEQHVAHERVLFEQIETQWQIVAIEQPILLKQLSDDEIERLQALGLEVEAFGNNLWAVRSLPEILIGHEDCAVILQEMSQQDDPTMARATAACRSAIRNGTKLEISTIRDLLWQWQQTRNPHTCPHGRPICLAIDESDLARFFRRNWIISK